ncbi:MAG TPA: NnrS family protein [Rhodopila sp.]|uniref:NnrS family protein n=1 Tax=Rhodopila sp. TaxID=2480087 RepID=UPI002C69BF33|nr:NnrS family protein [Rhodopila sp.]HVY15789.1 NnrS family protein [Rhodopila sp.]
MTLAAPGSEQRPPAALWSLAFRPFFLAAGIWAALALALWIGLLLYGGTLPSRFDPLTWHIHAMLFGFGFAAIAGFLLTAIPNWTGRAPIAGGPLLALAALWLAGRIVGLVSALMPLWLAAAVDLAFPCALCGVAAREIIAARNWRNLAMPIPVAVLGIADLLTYLELAGFNVAPGLGWRLAIVAVIALISAIGGRIIPAFTRNWLVKRGATKLPPASGTIDRIALAFLHAGLLGWAFFPAADLVGVLLVTAALLNLWRLARWRGFATVSEPLLAILHVGYAWLVIGAAMLGVGVLTGAVPESASIHAFTAGAIGAMVLAVMTRVARGHTGRPLEADHVTVVIYLLITAAGATRVLAAWQSDPAGLLAASAALWVASFGLFAASYGPVLLKPRIDVG